MLTESYSSGIIIEMRLFVCYDHTRLKAPHPVRSAVRSAKLSNVRPASLLGSSDLTLGDVFLYSSSMITSGGSRVSSALRFMAAQ
ncbi:hypothetical protein M514_25600 [Trichuris suis]|uniref:Uncharacterized protein n=1 Tax=Trichuris suis TaxID=68888 RepID=A0A085MYB4_9BILA|nr:hypothetical protein M514_25600 [Trichuris suis]